MTGLSNLERREATNVAPIKAKEPQWDSARWATSKGNSGKILYYEFKL